MDHLRQAIRQLKSAIPEGRRIWCRSYSKEGGVIKARVFIDDRLYDFWIPDYYGLEKKLEYNLIYNFNQFREFIENRATDYERLK